MLFKALRCDIQRLNEFTEKELTTILTEKQMGEYQKIQDKLRPRLLGSKPPGVGKKGPEEHRGGMGGGGWSGEGMPLGIWINIPQ